MQVEKQASAERGSVLLTTLILMILLTLIGIGGVNIASTDLRITGNYRIYTENLMLADGAVNRAAAVVRNAVGENIAGTNWPGDIDGVYNVRNLDERFLIDADAYNWRWDPVSNRIDVDAVVAGDAWENAFNPVALDGEPDTQYVVFMQVSPGTPDDRDISAVVVARSRKNDGNVIIEAGIKAEDF